MAGNWKFIAEASGNDSLAMLLAILMTVLCVVLAYLYQRLSSSKSAVPLESPTPHDSDAPLPSPSPQLVGEQSSETENEKKDTDSATDSDLNSLNSWIQAPPGVHPELLVFPSFFDCLTYKPGLRLHVVSFASKGHAMCGTTKEDDKGYVKVPLTSLPYAASLEKLNVSGFCTHTGCKGAWKAANMCATFTPLK